MQKSEYENIFKNEDSHFYYQAINSLVLSLLRREGIKAGDKILDAGCGTGGLLSKVSKIYDAQGVDISSEALKFCKLRKVRANTGSLEKLPFKSQSFEAVTSVDVIYHKFIKDDSRALSELVRVLKPGGILILRAPAFNFLKNDHDKVVMTNKRYTGKELKDLAKKVKLEVIQISYLNPSLFLGSIISRTLLSLRGVFDEAIHLSSRAEQSEVEGSLHSSRDDKIDTGSPREYARDDGGVHSSINKIHPVINAVGLGILKLENWLVRMGINLPFGQGVLLVARKKDSHIPRP